MECRTDRTCTQLTNRDTGTRLAVRSPWPCLQPSMPQGTPTLPGPPPVQVIVDPLDDPALMRATPSRSSTSAGASAIHSPTASSEFAPASTAHAVRASTAARAWRTPRGSRGSGILARRSSRPGTSPGATAGCCRSWSRAGGIREDASAGMVFHSIAGVESSMILEAMPVDFPNRLPLERTPRSGSHRQRRSPGRLTLVESQIIVSLASTGVAGLAVVASLVTTLLSLRAQQENTRDTLDTQERLSAAQERALTDFGSSG